MFAGSSWTAILEEYSMCHFDWIVFEATYQEKCCPPHEAHGLV